VKRLRSADVIVHAGDLSTMEVLGDLRAVGPRVVAVHGNVDDAAVRAVLPESATLDLDGITVAVIHDAGPRTGRIQRLRRRFPGADAVIFGHSHIPLRESDPATGFQILNPGSPTERRRAPCHTMAVGETGDDRITFALVELD
jgi:hypothetical protein